MTNRSNFVWQAAFRAREGFNCMQLLLLTESELPRCPGAWCCGLIAFTAVKKSSLGQCAKH